MTENTKGHAEGYNYSLVGSVPLSMLEGRKPTANDAIGGRIQSDGLAYYGRKWETIEQVLNAAIENDVKICTAEGCACRKLFVLLVAEAKVQQ